ncbi:MAG: arylesterase [Saprospiraceae bacterium]
MRKYQYCIILTFGIIYSCNNKPNNAEHVVEITTKVPISSTEVKKKQVQKTILFFGDSLTAGYGLDEEDSFPSLVQQRLDSLGHNYTSVNGGLSGETTAGGRGRIDWVLEQPVDIFVLELGANDMLRGLDITATRNNLKDILDSVKSKYPSAKMVIAGMLAPPNMGADYATEFQSIFKDLAAEYNAGLIPFLLAGLETRPDLILADGKHPNANGQKIVLENVWKVLEAHL